LFFRVTTLAEICNPERTRIRKCFLKEPTSPYVNEINPSTLQWPNQGKTSKRGFQLWQKCLNNCFNVYRGRINHKFGNWQVLIKNNSWNHYLQLSTGSLFTKSKDSFYHISVESRKKTKAIYENDRSQFCRTQYLPSDCIPISLRLNRKRNILIATYSPIMKPERIRMNDLPHRTHCLIENRIVTDENKFRQLFSKDKFTIYIASDGGVHSYEGTF
jgi:hypothetical protein